MIGGNDSVDSMTYNHICPNCIKSFMSNYIDATMDSNTPEIEVRVNLLNPQYYGDYDYFEYGKRLVNEDKLNT